MNGNDEEREHYPYWPPSEEPYVEEQPGGRTALYVSIGAAGLAATGLVTALVIGLADAGAPRTSGTPPDGGATQCQTTG